MIGSIHAGRDTGYWAVTYRPLLPFAITDPALLIAFREGVALNQEQADALRRRVAELEASVQRWADFWGMSIAAVARVRLAEIAAERQGRIERLNGLNRAPAAKSLGLRSDFNWRRESGARS